MKFCFNFLKLSPFCASWLTAECRTANRNTIRHMLQLVERYLEDCIVLFQAH